MTYRRRLSTSRLSRLILTKYPYSKMEEAKLFSSDMIEGIFLDPVNSGGWVGFRLSELYEYSALLPKREPIDEVMKQAVAFNEEMDADEELPPYSYYTMMINCNIFIIQVKSRP